MIFDATNSCQACYLHGEHDRCTEETTLGTKSCACRLSDHEAPPRVLRETRLPNKPHNHPASLVLCDRGESYEERYVTWVRVEPITGKSYYVWGHYCETLAEANEDFDVRLKENT